MEKIKDWFLSQFESCEKYYAKDKRLQNHTFYLRDGECLFFVDPKWPSLTCSHEKIWSVLEDMLGEKDFTTIKQFLKDQVLVDIPELQGLKPTSEYSIDEKLAEQGIILSKEKPTNPAKIETTVKKFHQFQKSKSIIEEVRNAYPQYQWEEEYQTAESEEEFCCDIETALEWEGAIIVDDQVKIEKELSFVTEDDAMVCLVYTDADLNINRMFLDQD